MGEKGAVQVVQFALVGEKATEGRIRYLHLYLNKFLNFF
jgi:hypothetical protein